jgi:hypothetical protein
MWGNTIQGGWEVTCPPKGFKTFPPDPKAYKDVQHTNASIINDLACE